MRFGIATLLTDYGVMPGAAAKAVEDAGFDSFWLGDHTHLPCSRASVSEQWWHITEAYWRNLDMFIALTAAATATTTLKLGTALCVLVERDAITVAKETATLDLISGGRLIFGVGAGWNAEEMANHGTTFSTRWKVLRERTEVVRTIWTEDEPEYHGAFESFDPIHSYPKPVQRPHPPIIVGGNGPKSMELAATLRADWMPMFYEQGWPEVRDKHMQLRRMVAESGGEPDAIELLAYCLEPPSPALIESMAEAGVQQVVLSLSQDRDGGFLRAVDEHAKLLLA